MPLHTGRQLTPARSQLFLYGQELREDGARLADLVQRLPSGTRAVIHLAIFSAPSDAAAGAPSLGPLAAAPTSPATPPEQPKAEESRDGPQPSERPDAAPHPPHAYAAPYPVPNPAAMHPVMAAAYHAALAALTQPGAASHAPPFAPPSPFFSHAPQMVMVPQMVLVPAYALQHGGHFPCGAPLCFAQPPYPAGAFMSSLPQQHAGARAPLHRTWAGLRRAPAGAMHGGAAPGDAAPAAQGGAAGDAGPRRRVWTWTFRISLRALVQLIVMLVVLSQHLSLRRFAVIVAGAALMAVAQLGSLQRLLRDVAARLTAPLRPAPAAVPLAEGAGEEGAPRNEAPPLPPRTMLGEIGVAMLGFVASLLPGFNADAANAAAIAAAQQGLMRERAMAEGVDE